MILGTGVPDLKGPGWSISSISGFWFRMDYAAQLICYYLRKAIFFTDLKISLSEFDLASIE